MLWTISKQMTPSSVQSYVQSNETMAINMFQRSRLTFDLSAKVAHIRVPSIYENIFFSETFRPIEFEFHMETTYDKLTKIYTHFFGDMTKMGDIIIYDINI